MIIVSTLRASCKLESGASLLPGVLPIRIGVALEGAFWELAVTGSRVAVPVRCYFSLFILKNCLRLAEISNR